MGNCLAGSSVKESGLTRLRRKAKYANWQDHPEVKKLDISEVIGHGGYSEIHLATDKTTGEFVAVKVVALNQKDMTYHEEKMLENEARFLPMLEHNNIIKCHKVLESRNHLVMITEYLGGGELLKRLAKEGDEHSEAKVCSVFANLVRAVHYCHTLGIAHRDIKPENIMFGSASSGAAEGSHSGKALQPKLLDFGLASLITPSQVIRGVVGSPGFIAPEIINNKPHSLAMDIWSLGTLLFMMLTGRHMFDRLDVKSLFYGKKSIMEAPGLKDPHYVALSPCAKDLLMRMLADNPAARPSAKEVLEHAFIREQGAWEALGHQADSIKKRFAQIAHMRRVKGLAFAMNFGTAHHHEFDDFQENLFDHHRTTIKRIRAKAGDPSLSTESRSSAAPPSSSSSRHLPSSKDSSTHGGSSTCSMSHHHSTGNSSTGNASSGSHRTNKPLDTLLRVSAALRGAPHKDDRRLSLQHQHHLAHGVSGPNSNCISRMSYSHPAQHHPHPHHRSLETDDGIPLPPMHVDPLAVLNAMPELCRANTLPGFEDVDDELHGGSPTITAAAMRNILLPRAMSAEPLLCELVDHVELLKQLAVAPLDSVMPSPAPIAV